MAAVLCACACVCVCALNPIQNILIQELSLKQTGWKYEHGNGGCHSMKVKRCQQRDISALVMPIMSQFYCNYKRLKMHAFMQLGCTHAGNARSFPYNGDARNTPDCGSIRHGLPPLHPAWGMVFRLRHYIFMIESTDQ